MQPVVGSEAQLSFGLNFRCMYGLKDGVLWQCRALQLGTNIM